MQRNIAPFVPIGILLGASIGYILVDGWLGAIFGAIYAAAAMMIGIIAWAVLGVIDDRREKESPLSFDGDYLDTLWKPLVGGRRGELLSVARVAGAEVVINHYSTPSLIFTGAAGVTGYTPAIFELPLSRVQYSDSETVQRILAIVGYDAPKVAAALADLPGIRSRAKSPA